MRNDGGEEGEGKPRAKEHRLAAQVATLNGAELAQVADAAQRVTQADSPLVGGASTIVISTTTIIIVLLLIILLVVAD